MAHGELAVVKSPDASVDIGRYRAFELQLIHDDAAYANPFWDVLIEAVFTSPGGVAFATEGFYYDQDTWMVRFAPTIEGTWAYYLTMTGGGDNYQTSGTVECVPSSLHGPIRVHPTNPKRMVCDDGTLYNAVGTNIWIWDSPFLNGAWISGATSRERWDIYFGEYASHGCNVYRRLLGNELHPTIPWYQGQSSIWRGDTGGPDRYDLDRAKEVDTALESAAEHNMATILTFLDNPQDWSGNPMNVVNGGPLSDPSEDYDVANPVVVYLHRRYHRYIVNRYAVWVGVWQLFNEYTAPSIEWKTEMATHIRSCDPYGHFVNNTTKFLAPSDAYQDLMSPHLYAYDYNDHLDTGTDGTATARYFDAYVELCTEGFTAPSIFDELGTGNCMPNNYPDAWRVALWSTYFRDSGLAFWDDQESLVFGENPCTRSWNANVYISDFTRDLILWRQEFAARFPQTMEQVSPSTNDAANLRAFGLEDPSLGLYAAWIHNYQDHSVTNTGKTLTATLPVGDLLAEWIDPKTGLTIVGPTAISGGAQTLPIPDFIQDIALAVRPDSSVDILTTSLPDAIYGMPYYKSLEAKGGGRPNAWALVAGALPDGIHLDTESGLLSGAPIYNGTYCFTVEVTAFDTSTDTADLAVTTWGDEGEPCPDCTPSAATLYEAGDDLCLEIPDPVAADSTFLWTKNEESLAPRTTPVNCRTLLVSGLTLADSGTYECAYDDGSKAPATYEIAITVAENVPAAGPVALIALLVLIGLGCLSREIGRAR